MGLWPKEEGASRTANCCTSSGFQWVHPRANWRALSFWPITTYYKYVEEHLEVRLRESGVVWMNYASNLFLNSREYLRQHEEGAFEHLCKVFVDKMIDKCRAINAIALKYLSNMIESNNLPSMQAIDAIRAQEDC